MVSLGLPTILLDTKDTHIWRLSMGQELGTKTKYYLFLSHHTGVMGILMDPLYHSHSKCFSSLTHSTSFPTSTLKWRSHNTACLFGGRWDLRGALDWPLPVGGCSASHQQGLLFRSVTECQPLPGSEGHKPGCWSQWCPQSLACSFYLQTGPD